MSFRSILLLVNACLLGFAGVFLGTERPAGTAGRLLAYACLLAQVLTITRLVRDRRTRRRAIRNP